MRSSAAAAVAGLLAHDVPLAPRTTLGLGGAARHFAVCASVQEVRDCLSWAAAEGVPVHVLGGGSNTVVLDRGFPGLVIQVGLRGIASQAGAGGVAVAVAAGEEWDAVVGYCTGRGLGGLECLAGIPGLAGAAPIQNIGAYGQEVADTIQSVRVLDRQALDEQELDGSDCAFGYRTSRFKRADRNRYIVLGVTFLLQPDAVPTVRYTELQQHLQTAADPQEQGSGAAALERVRATVLELRRAKSMVVDDGDPETRSAGSFFLNPVLSDAQLERVRGAVATPEAVPTYPAAGGTKVSAAWLIEQAGFRRGQRHGGCAISRRHALSLVNHGGSAAELLELAASIQAAVARRFGVHLEQEPVVVG